MSGRMSISKDLSQNNYSKKKMKPNKNWFLKDVIVWLYGGKTCMFESYHDMGIRRIYYGIFISLAVAQIRILQMTRVKTSSQIHARKNTCRHNHGIRESDPVMTGKHANCFQIIFTAKVFKMTTWLWKKLEKISYDISNHFW